MTRIIFTAALVALLSACSGMGMGRNTADTGGMSQQSSMGASSGSMQGGMRNMNNGDGPN